MNFKNIHIGDLIRQKIAETQMKTSRICNFFKCDEEEIQKMLEAETLDTKRLLGWSKLLEYDFFRIYSHHLILFAPPKKWSTDNTERNKKSTLPEFRKNLYTIEIIDFIIEQLSNGEKTKMQVINEYRIPKTTLYKWINKYKNESGSHKKNLMY